MGLAPFVGLPELRANERLCTMKEALIDVDPDVIYFRDGTDLDLSDITAVRFELGSFYGAWAGRIGLDDILLTTEALISEVKEADGGGGAPDMGAGGGMPGGMGGMGGMY